MIYLNQDITTVTGPAIILHGVNCQGVMGAGVAKAISDKWPKVKERYLQHPKGKMALGGINIIKVAEDIVVINCYTQEFYGMARKCNPYRRTPASIDAIRDCLIKVAVIVIMAPNNGSAIKLFAPKIGCCLGGLNWELQVEPIFRSVEDNFGITFNICEI